MRPLVAEHFLPKLITLVRSITCDNGKTRKDLWRLHDGVLVESVLMRYSDRTTVCISSQAGCGMNCPFCATGQAGLTRNLTAGEITAQIVASARACATGELPGGPTRLSNVVFMGMGEPLANYNAVLRTVRNIITPQPDGLGIGARSVTVSTVGLVTGIEKLTAEDLQVTLAVSLHTPDDEYVTLWCRLILVGKLKRCSALQTSTQSKLVVVIPSNMRSFEISMTNNGAPTYSDAC